MEEIKRALDFMLGGITTVSKQQKIIMELMGEVKELKRQNEGKNKRMAFLESQVADLEQYTHMNNIVSGLETRPQLYAMTVVDGEEPIEPDQDSQE